MAWYRTGTVSVVQNSGAVSGTNTAFVANCRVGDAFVGPDGRMYEVTNVASDTSISITPGYIGAAASSASYALVPVQGYQKGLGDQVRSWVNTYGPKMAALGTTGNYDVLPVEKGGTAASDAASARANLGVPLQASFTDSTASRVLLVGAFGLGAVGGVPIVSDLYNGKAFEAVQFNTGTSGAATSFGCALRMQGSSGEWRNVLQFGTGGELTWTTVTNPSSGGAWRNYNIYHSGQSSTAYIPATLQNSYTAQPGRLNGYRLYLGKVEVKMNVFPPSGYTDGLVVATLPSGLRPDTAFMVPGTFNTRVIVGTDGSIAINGGSSGTFTSFSFEFKPS